MRQALKLNLFILQSIFSVLDPTNLSVIFQLTSGGGAYKDFLPFLGSRILKCVSPLHSSICLFLLHTIAKLLLINIRAHFSHVCNKLIRGKTLLIVEN